MYMYIAAEMKTKKKLGSGKITTMD